MSTLTKFLIGLLLIGAGVGLYVYLTRRRTTAAAPAEPQAWAMSDLAQGTQIATLTNLVGNGISRDEAYALFAGLTPTVVNNPTAETSIEVSAATAETTQEFMAHFYDALTATT